MLLASHAKAWSDCSNRERLDAYNGLLLTPNLDRLFDKGLIGFTDAGELLLSGLLSKENAELLGVGPSTHLRLVRPRHLPYLRAHRTKHGLKSSRR